MEDQDYGETEPLSQRAVANVEHPPYWRNHAEMIVGCAGSEYEAAYMEVQKQIHPVLEADRSNPFTKSEYSSLASLLTYVRPILLSHGFTMRQFAGQVRSHSAGAKTWWSMPVATRFCHVESMQWEMAMLPMPVDSAAHSFGAAMTYGKRYTLMSLLGIATADDDAMTFIKNRVDQEAIEEATSGIIEKINACKSEGDLSKWLEANEDGLKLLSDAAVERVRKAYAARLKALRDDIAQAKKKGGAEAPPASVTEGQ